IMERQVGHLARLVDDVLDTTRIQRGQVQLRREQLDLARLVRTTAEDRRGLLEGSGLRLEVDVPETPVWVSGDAARLTQILGNVLDNARKFTPEGGRVVMRLVADERS